MSFIHLSETDSTNRWLRDRAEEFSSEEFTVVWTDYQTAGRGCGTNTWESEPGMNLLFSVLCHPKNIPAAQQFLLLEVMALAVKDALDVELTGRHGGHSQHQGGTEDRIRIKWPNDIYWRDRKLGGTLTECSLSGQNMRWCIIGTGINVNQTEFSPQLPNPISLKQITGNTLEPETLLQRIISCFEHRLHYLEHEMANAGSSELCTMNSELCTMNSELCTMHYELCTEYMSALYRRQGYHSYRDQNGDFEAEIISVAPDGTLTLRDRLQRLRHYKFKEVGFVISSN